MILTKCFVNTALKVTKINCETDGQRLDVFLSNSLPGITRSGAQKLIEQQRVLLCVDVGEPVTVRKSHQTSAGEVFHVTLDEPVETDLLPQNIPLDIVYEDDDICVVNKPRGMVVHPSPGHADSTLVNALMHHCGDSLSGIGGELRPGIVHRIDKDTSGLILVAKNDLSHVNLAQQLADRTMTREYEAVVKGALKSDEGVINAPIGRHPRDRKRQAVTTQPRQNPREAVTYYEVVARYNGYTHVKCRLKTGRTHQIRVHMAHIGHPIVGDLVYGRKSTDLGLSGQCLHARRLKFIHPRSGESVELSTDLPEYFTALLSRLE